MMKKTLILVAVMALALCGTANAYIAYIGTTLPDGSGGGQVQFGDPTPSTGGWVAPVGDYLAIADVTTGALLAKDFIKPAPAAWQFGVWGTPGLSATNAKLKVWINQLGNGGTTGSVINDGAVWALTAPGGAKLWTGTIAAVSTASAPLFTVDIPIVKTTTPLNGAAVYTFAPDVVPEPGSMLALASGLIGLVGFGIRRRK